ncbi:MAG: hypothetical protein IPG83_18040 [Novosphingobium sp.]|nr:hypothetical protein [Novosphingobium sp.]
MRKLSLLLLLLLLLRLLLCDVLVKAARCVPLPFLSERDARKVRGVKKRLPRLPREQFAQGHCSALLQDLIMAGHPRVLRPVQPHGIVVNCCRIPRREVPGRGLV